MNKEQLKNKTLKFLNSIPTEEGKETMDKFNLAYKTMKFYQYEDDPEFTHWFNEFCIKKAKKEKGESDYER